MSDQKIVDRADRLQKFTKDELIEYILAVSFMLRRHPPARTILEFRAENIHKKIDKNLRETDDLIAAAKDKRITAGEFSKRYSRLQSQWTDLDNELRSIERRLYDELES